MERTAECSEKCRLVLRRGIYLCLGLDPDEGDNDRPPIYNLVLPRIEYRGEFQISPDELKQTPRLTVETVNVKVQDHADGRRTVSCQDIVDCDAPAEVRIQTTVITETGIEISIEDERLIPRKP